MTSSSNEGKLHKSITEELVLSVDLLLDMVDSKNRLFTVKKYVVDMRGIW